MDSEKLYRVQEEDLSKLEELLCRSFAADPLYVDHNRPEALPAPMLASPA